MPSRYWMPVLALFVTAVASAAEPLPTPEQIQESFDKKDWQAVLAATNRTLMLKGAAAQPYDRVDLWMKKAEAQLHLNQFVPASQSMAKAAAEKTATPPQADQALALSALFRKSDAKGFKTSAKLGPVKTYNVLEPAGRADALAALFDAAYTEVGQQIDRAKASTEGKALAALAQDVAELRAVDRVVNKSAEKSDALEKTLVGNFVDQVKKWAKPTDKRLDELAKLGDERVEVRSDPDRYGRVMIATHRRGNTPQEVGEVKKMMEQSKKFAIAYGFFEASLSASGKEAIKPVVDTVEPTYEKAKSILESANRTN